MTIQLIIIFTILIQWHYKIICLLNTLILIFASKWLKILIILNHLNTWFNCKSWVRVLHQP